METSLIALVVSLLKKNKIPFDKKELTFQIQSHPSYPSLHAITGVLSHFNIENIAAEVPTDIETLLQLPNYFIAQIQDKQGPQLVFAEKKQQHIHLNHQKKQVLSHNEFLKKFTGILVAVEKPENQATKPKSTFLFPTLLISFVCILSVYLIISPPFSFIHFSYLILAIIGLFISIIIVKQELGIHTTIGEVFCSSNNNKKDCDAVLSSKGATLINGYKLSDISLLYFCSLTIATAIQFKTPSLSYLLSLLAIPITCYSIYYQYFVVKKWCLLCLSLVGVLWCQGILAIINPPFSHSWNIHNIAVYTIIILFTFTAWYYIKPLLFELHELRKTNISNTKFKRNITLFETMLQQSPQINTQLPDQKEIIFGNPKASLEIVLITNPFCGHCKSVHTQIHDILKQYGAHVKIIIRFNINTTSPDQNPIKVTTRLLELYKEEGTISCLEAMTDIYENGKAAQWLKKWGECSNEKAYRAVLEAAYSWCTKHNINFTPHLLLNGKAYPKQYQRTDLLFFIEELANAAVDS